MFQGVNKGVNFTPRGQISPLGAKFTPRGEIRPWGPGVKLRMTLCGSVRNGLNTFCSQLKKIFSEGCHVVKCGPIQTSLFYVRFEAKVNFLKNQGLMLRSQFSSIFGKIIGVFLNYQC
jgi:hypothetical protein